MKERPEVRIVVEKAKNGQREIVQVDPRTGQESRTGLGGKNDSEVDKIVQQIAARHERVGNKVTYKEM